MVISRLSPTPTVVPIGWASPITSAKPGIGESFDNRSATAGVRGIIFIPAIRASVPALRIAPREGPTAVDRPVAAHPLNKRRVTAASGARASQAYRSDEVPSKAANEIRKIMKAIAPPLARNACNLPILLGDVSRCDKDLLADQGIEFIIYFEVTATPTY